MEELGSWLNTQRRQILRWRDADQTVRMREAVAVASERARLDLLATARQWEGARPVVFVGGVASSFEVVDESIRQRGPA